MCSILEHEDGVASAVSKIFNSEVANKAEMDALGEIF